MSQMPEATSGTAPTNETTDRVRVRILLFSVLREKMGRSCLELDVGPERRVVDVLERLVSLHPDLAPHRASMRVAVNASYTDVDHLLQDGDELALITPVSGG